MTPEEVAAYARGVEAALQGRKDPEFTLMLISDVVSLGERVRGPAAIFSEHGGKPGEEVLVPVAGLRTLERVPRRPREPETSDEGRLKLYAQDYSTWCDDERRVNALLDLHKKRLRALLTANMDYDWLARTHPQTAARLPRKVLEQLGALIEAFGAGGADVSSSAAIFRYVHEWPRNAHRANERPWQDASGWEE